MNENTPATGQPTKGSAKGKIGITAGVAALGAAAAIGLGVAASASADTSTPTPTPTTTSGPSGTTPQQPNGDLGSGHKGKGGPGMRGMMDADLSALATKLGVDEAKLKTAIERVRTDLKAARQSAGQNSTKPDPATRQSLIAGKLATELGISKDKVESAMTDLRAQATADREAALTARLKQAVTDGKLTQAEADAVLKAAKTGVIGMGGPGRGAR